MTKHRLETLKTVATWAGVGVTLSGIMLSIFTGGSLPAACLALFGVLLTCCGHWVGGALARHQAAEKAADQKRLTEAQSRIEILDQQHDLLRTQIQKRASLEG